MADDARHPTGENPERLGRLDTSDESTPTPYGPERPAFAPRPRPPLIQRVAPVTAHLQSYRRRYLRPDLLAGVTVAALAIPAGMAYAEVAGLAPVAGLYALLLPAVAYALLGSSRQLVVGPKQPWHCSWPRSSPRWPTETRAATRRWRPCWPS
jgi:hypothetical protein